MARPRSTLLVTRLIIALFVVAAVLVGTLSYSQPLSLSIDVGKDFDAPYVAGMYFPSPNGSGDFRWTNGEGEIIVRGVSASYPMSVSVRPTNDLRPWYEINRPASLMISANGQVVFNGQLASGAHWYSFTVPPSPSHQLNLIFSSRAWNAQNGMVRLGVSLDEIRLTPPPDLAPFADLDWRQVLLLAAIVAMLCVVATTLGIWGMVAVGLIGLLGGGLLLWLARPLFALYAPAVAIGLAVLLLLLNIQSLQRHWVWLLFGGTAGLYLLFNSGQISSDDDLIKYYVTNSLLTRHNLVFTPLYGPEGYARYGLGHYLAEAPFVALGKLAEALRGAPLDRLLQFSATLMNPIACALLVCLIYAMARRLYESPHLALLLAGVAGLATIIFPYALTTATEPLLAVWLLAALYCALHYFNDAITPRRGDWLARAGLAMGMLVITKSEYVVFSLLIVGWWLLRSRLREGAGGKSLLYQSVWLILPIGLAIGETVTLNLVQGVDLAGTANAPEVFTAPDVGRLFTGVVGALFSPGKSIFLYSPPLLLLPFALPAFVRRYAWEAALWLTLFGAALLFYGRLSFWAGDLAYGDRYLMPFTPLLLLPIGALLPQLQAAGWGRRVFAVLAGLGLAVQLLGVLTDFNAPFFFMGAPAGSTFGQMYHMWEFDWPYIEPVQHLKALFTGRIREQAVTQLSYYGLPGFADYLVPGLLLAIIGFSAICLRRALAATHEKTSQPDEASSLMVPKGRFELPRP